MVRTSSAGIRVSSGKSAKKGGGGGGGGGGSGSSGGSSSSTPSKKSNSGGASRLPSIPHTETPSWQKPITNFFHSGANTSKKDEVNEISGENDTKSDTKPSTSKEVSETTEMIGNYDDKENLSINAEGSSQSNEGNQLKESDKVTDEIENKSESDNESKQIEIKSKSADNVPVEPVTKKSRLD